MTLSKSSQYKIIKTKHDVVKTTYRQISLKNTLIIGTVKICHKVVLTLNKYYSKSTIKVPRKSAKICPKLTKTSKRHDRYCCGIPVVKLTFVCRIVVPLIFNVRKKGLMNVNLEKYPRQIQHPVTDLKMELLAKIVNDFKL